ncbi:CoA ester lyase [Pseudoroseicyclus sp. CXY001]|uniref:HpcH/HpaI aldolase/citrate lyase family protein n=1 Tax=Pseudoroseicyclus sp. CXY001 TaxID=3242492 RepID=UPI00358DD013
MAGGMRLRSLLFVPGDRPERFAKAAASGADALILDLEDSVAPGRKSQARQAVAAALSGPRDVPLLVRVNPLGGDEIGADLQAIAGGGADGVLLPKCQEAGDVARLVEALGPGAPPILPIATETPAAVFALGGYHAVSAHLLGLTWGVEDLSSAIGARASRLAGGVLTPPFEALRALALFGAHAAGTPAIETVYPDIADLDGLARMASAARRDGFAGMMAIHPAQVAAINAAFSPSEAELDEARAIVAAFAGAEGRGAVQLGGRMLDRPHLAAAERLLASAEAERPAG